MRRATWMAWLAVGLVIVPAAAAQSTVTDYRDEFLDHFERSSMKIVTLARAMPPALYPWSPGEDVMAVVQVYTHIARYNFMYLADNLGIPAPDDVDVDGLEMITDRAQVLALLQRSVAHVNERVRAMTPDHLAASTRLYGRDVAGWAVLFQLLAHMNEHVGQSVAYARMNGVAPPWSR